MADTHAGDLIAAFGALLDSDAAALDRADRLSHLAVAALDRAGVPARCAGPGLITVRLDSDTLALQIAGLDAPLTREQVAESAGTALLSLRGYAFFPNQGRVPLLDRQHLEAVLAGLVDPADLLTGLAHRAADGARPYVPLAEFLRIAEPRTVPQCAPPDRLPPPWELVEMTSRDVRTRQVLGGGPGWPGWPEVSGLAVLEGDRLLLTTADGLLEIHARRDGARWFLPMAGLRGSPLVRPGGRVLVMCRDAVLAYDDDRVTAVAGGLPDATCLLADDQGGAWVLSGGGDTLALTRIGDELGRQQRYRVRFAADVHGTACLGGRRFYLAAGGHSAVIDLGRADSVRDTDELIAYQPRPAHVIALDAWTVLTASRDGQGTLTTVHRTHILDGRADLITELRLNQIHGMAAADRRRVYVAGDVRGSDQAQPRPVIVELTLPPLPPAAPAPDPAPLEAVRVSARGDRRDYRLDSEPVAAGDRAEVFGAYHRPTGIRVAFKRLRHDTAEDTARLRHEIELGRHFADDPHVVPILDFGPAGDWLVRPLADTTAETMGAELRDPELLRGLVRNVCAGLRRAHREGWIHGDLTPADIRWLDGAWAVGGWGEAYQAGPQADIYRLGQIVGWALTGQWPRAGGPPIQAGKPWDDILAATTHGDPVRRPATVDDVLLLLDPPPPPPPVPVAPPLLAEPVVAAGILGRVEFDGRTVTVVHDGLGAPGKGRRAVELGAVEAVTVKPGTTWFHGYVQVVVRDEDPAPELRGLFLGGRPPMDDSLSVSIRKRHNAEADRLKEAVEEAKLRNPSKSP